MKNLQSRAQRVIAEQSFSVFLGAELTDISPGHVELRLPLKKELLQQHGFVHGGVISYLADNALTFAGGSVLGDSVTSEFKINYLKPASGDTLIARAKVISHGRRQAVCQCLIYAVEAEDTLVAMAQGTIVVIS